MASRNLSLALAALVLLAAAGCQLEKRSDRSDEGVPATRTSDSEVTVFGGYEPPPTEADIDQGRRDTSWRGFTMGDTDFRVDTTTTTSRSDTMGVRTPRPVRVDSAAYARALRLPLSGDTDGPSVTYTQILLDRARFSPGQIDGKWGQNTEKAIFWLQRREGLPASGTLDRATLRRLVQLAEAPAMPEALVVLHTLTADEVEGPFQPIPDDPYAQAEMDRLGYTSLSEKLGEAFHAAPALLRSLNQNRSLDSLSAGDTLRVPSLSPRERSGAGAAARLVVSDGGRYLHALDATGRIIYHFPAVLGASYDPSPTDTLEITSVVDYPGWHYQPSILAHVDDSEKDAHIPPGPNNAVGVEWIGLSKEHYGIHGTAEPATIGHTVSAGCVRLTNWDAQTLSRLVSTGTPVAFRDVNGSGAQPSAPATSTPADTAAADTTSA